MSTAMNNLKNALAIGTFQSDNEEKELPILDTSEFAINHVPTDVGAPKMVSLLHRGTALANPGLTDSHLILDVSDLDSCNALLSSIIKTHMYQRLNVTDYDEGLEKVIDSAFKGSNVSIENIIGTLLRYNP